MGEMRPLVERMDIFERKQHNNVPCTISFQETLQQSSTDKVTNKYRSSYLKPFLFIAFLYSSSDNTN